MASVLVLYYSSYGHIEQMAYAAAEGARSAGAKVDIKRVTELVPEEVARKSGYKLDQDAPLAQPNDVVAHDAIIFGTPTRFGNMASQMKNFIDQLGGLWAQDKLIGKVGSSLHFHQLPAWRTGNRRFCRSTLSCCTSGSSLSVCPTLTRASSEST